jgi:hypothetical protein
MGGEGFKVTCLLIVGFVLMGLAGMAMLFLGKADVSTLKEFYIGLGILAGLFGVPSAIQSWVQTRGQTSTQIIESTPLNYETFVGTDSKGE